jgi:acetyl esterase/lipase
MILGSYKAERPRIDALAQPSADCLREGAVVLSPDYRLSPKYTASTLSDDCLAGWNYMLENADELGIDTSRMAVVGGSAGGGLAAALVQRIIDEAAETGGPVPVAQVLSYPMLDDRTVCRHDAGSAEVLSHYAGWAPQTNRYGWTAYLGHAPEMDKHSPYVPARRADLSKTPKTWIGVGTLDLFHEEDVEWAKKLKAAGVYVELVVVEGAFHGFEGYRPKSKVAQDFLHSQNQFLRAILE